MVSRVKPADHPRDGHADQLLLACEWADGHPVLEDEPHGSARQARLRELERVATQRRIAADWIADHEPDRAFEASGLIDDWEVDPWLPEYAWDCVASFAAALGMPTSAGARLIDDALFLRARMPRLWTRVCSGEVEAWRARRIAQAGWRQPADVVDALDQEVTARAHSIGAVALDNLLDSINLRLHAEVRELDQIAALDDCHVSMGARFTHTGLAEMSITAEVGDVLALDTACASIARVLAAEQAATSPASVEPLGVRRARAIGILADPAQALALLTSMREDDMGVSPDDLDEGRPLARRVRVVVHLTPDLVTGGLGDAPVVPVATSRGGRLRDYLSQAVADWCGRPGTHVTVQPVIDTAAHTISTSPQVTSAMKTRVGLRRASCAFPHCSRPAAGCDADHRVPVGDGGASCDCNLHPLCRQHHRLKTLAGWTYVALPEPNGPPVRFLWTDPHGMSFLVDPCGTTELTPDGWDGCYEAAARSRRRQTTAAF